MCGKYSYCYSIISWASPIYYIAAFLLNVVTKSWQIGIFKNDITIWNGTVGMTHIWTSRSLKCLKWKYQFSCQLPKPILSSFLYHIDLWIAELSPGPQHAHMFQLPTSNLHPFILSHSCGLRIWILQHQHKRINWCLDMRWDQFVSELVISEKVH